MRSVVLSFDDGTIYDKRFIELLDKYGLKATFNLNSGLGEYVWYLEKTLEHGWSVDDLASQVKSQLYERQAVANKISNFEKRHNLS